MSGPRVLEALLDLLFPPRCACCGEVIARGVLCDGCRPTLRLRDDPAAPLVPPLDGLAAAYLYQDAGAALMREFKFHRQLRCYDLELREGFEAAVCAYYAGRSFDFVLPVPLHKASRRERGFNQSAYIAQRLAERMGLPCDERALQKLLHNRIQHTLSREEREQNVKGVYRAAAELAAGKSILLVDDIVTTGATLCECAATLKAAGAKRVCAAAVLATPAAGPAG
ncbi:ComF family protein [Clostridiaceae bacterium NSJ-31]|uniref:ComF family protein n=1 Tax=Ligaoa zhengdingensis TaxID=2763658 RepID=A0A926I336_9FIRM|nr:ComF family protein [Ligaoa zhengdingensis]MBC8545944.1 ComF family protein [Ligaoa zhengdingensis]